MMVPDSPTSASAATAAAAAAAPMHYSGSSGFVPSAAPSSVLPPAASAPSGKAGAGSSGSASLPSTNTSAYGGHAPSSLYLDESAANGAIYSSSPLPPGLNRAYLTANNRAQKLLDDLTPHLVPRWVGTALFTAVYLLRVFSLQGWHIVTYALGIYLLNLFIAFLSPQIDPAIAGSEDEDGPTLPTTSDEDFRPFIRRLPEFKFWYSATRAVAIAFFCTFFTFFDIPVFWPILVLYFCILFAVTMKRQIKHMVKYRYLPFSYGKRKYKGKEDGGKVVSSH